MSKLPVKGGPVGSIRVKSKNPVPSNVTGKPTSASVVKASIPCHGQTEFRCILAAFPELEATLL